MRQTLKYYSSAGFVFKNPNRLKGSYVSIFRVTIEKKDSRLKKFLEYLKRIVNVSVAKNC